MLPDHAGVDSNEDGILDDWKYLSPEEATAEIVNALAKRDQSQFQRLLPSEAELVEVGFSKEFLINCSSSRDG